MRAGGGSGKPPPACRSSGGAPSLPLPHAERDQVLQRLELRIVNELKLLDKVDEVLEGVVQVRVRLFCHHLLEVRVEGVRVHPEKTLVDDAHALPEVRREGHARMDREERLVGQLPLHPHKQVLHVARCRHVCRHLDLVAVRPGKRVRACTHVRAGLLRADVSQRPGEQVQLVEEVDRRHGDPLLLTRARGQLHLCPQILAAEGLLPLQEQGGITRVRRQHARGQQRGVPAGLLRVERVSDLGGLRLPCRGSLRHGWGLCHGAAPSRGAGALQERGCRRPPTNG
mmetsp:Transcript_62518/g.141011  ORF Transcript_62518/g.141011 Transcript_62518/m.141011 type:complete len:284 (+) Transcript_62518:182-1033(+)